MSILTIERRGLVGELDIELGVIVGGLVDQCWM
jgi:hypothetical protein